jgi:hypothetical protein
MEVLATRIMEHGNGLPEGTPVVAKEMLHLGSRAAVDQALSRLVRRGTLMRAGRGIYVRPVESRLAHAPLWRPRSSKPSPLNGARAWLRTVPPPPMSSA